MISVWKCPHCGARNLKQTREGRILNQYADGRVLYEISHPDDCPACNGKVSGAAILQGNYDNFAGQYVVHKGSIYYLAVAGLFGGGIMAAWDGVYHQPVAFAYLGGGLIGGCLVGVVLRLIIGRKVRISNM